MYARTKRRRLLAFALGLALVTTMVQLSAPAADSAVRPVQPHRIWRFHEYRPDGEHPVLVAEGTQFGGVLQEFFDFGPLALDNDGDGIATGNIFSSRSGADYSVFTEAPGDGFSQNALSIGSRVEMVQYQSFRKMTDTASLQVIANEARLEAGDFMGALRPSDACPSDNSICPGVMESELFFEITAYTALDQAFFHTAAGARLSGNAGEWDFDGWTYMFSPTAMWDQNDFTFQTDLGGVGGDLDALAVLNRPVTVDVDLSSIAVGEDFSIAINAFADAYNRRGGESFIDASFGNTTLDSSPQITATGLRRRPPEIEPIPQAGVVTIPCVAGVPNPDAGALQFDDDAYTIAEWAGASPQVVVTRTGGSVGAVSADITTSDGTAIAGTHYEPVTQTIQWGDGDTAARVVPIPIIQDDVPEPDKTVNLTLSNPGGCASLGTQDASVLTITDDDRPVTLPESFTVGGTVSGLEGTGLVLNNVGQRIDVDGSAFVFPQEFASGIPYEVTVATQPTDPAQACTISNGSGTIVDHDITDVAVDCVTVEAESGLDGDFGDGGKVSTPGMRGARSVTLDRDGKIVVAGDTSLARYDTDGTLDESFSGDGIVTTGLEAGLLDSASDVAVQTDDKIVVVGIIGSGASENFGVQRFLPDGALDTSFGDAGTVTTDFFGGIDRAYGVVIQPDEKIVVAGHAAIGAENDYAVARYEADGDPDPTFGGGDGLVTTNVQGRIDFGHAVVLQADGRIVVAGRASDGVANEDFGVVRYEDDGDLDPTFGGGDGIALADFGLGSIAEGVVLQPDDKIVVVGSAGTDFAAARFEANGGSDLSFGGGDGVVTTDFDLGTGGFLGAEFGRDVALQADGSIVVVGQSEGDRNLGVVRYDSGGNLDDSFDDDGIMTIDYFGGFDSGADVVIQPDGKIVAVGSANSGFSVQTALARILP